MKIKKEVILPRLDGIQHDLEKLKKLAEKDFEEFKEEDNFALAQFYLRRALEGVFNIGAHIVSRKTGNRVVHYKDIAIKLGEMGIVDEDYAKDKLVKMAGYRNRLTHFYADITPEELYKILREKLEDFNPFMKAIKDLMENPQKYGFEID